MKTLDNEEKKILKQIIKQKKTSNLNKKEVNKHKNNNDREN